MNSAGRFAMPLKARWPIVLYSVLAGILVLALLTLHGQRLMTEEEAYAQRVSESTARGIEGMIIQDMRNRVSTLSSLAYRWKDAGRTPRVAWENDVRNIIAGDPGYQAIEWIDTSYHVRWVVPSEGNQEAFNFDLKLNKLAFATTQLALNSGEAKFTPPLKLVQGGLGVVVYFPIYSGGQFDGFFVAVLNLHNWLESLLASELAAEHFINVNVDDQSVYSFNNTQHNNDEKRSAQRNFSHYDLEWQINVEPSAEYQALIRASSSNAWFRLGILLSAFIAISVYIAMSARQRASHIHDNAHHLSLLFENLPGMAYAGPIRESWPLSFVSDGCKALCGYDRNDFEQQYIKWNQLIHPEDRQGVWDNIQMAVKNHLQFELEYRIQTKNGEERWVWERGRVTDNTKLQTQELEGFITDITQRKNTELKLLQSLNFGEAILDTAVEAVITFDTNGCIETFNNAAQKMFDRTLDEVMGKRMDILASRILRQEYVDNIFDHIKDTSSSSSSSSLFYRQEGVGERRNGTLFPAEYVTTELEYQSERKFVCLIRDISKQRAAEDEARDHRDKLAHVDRLNTLGEMASGIAHEINQPLTAISLFAEGGKRLVGSGREDKLIEIFDKMSQHAIRAGAVIERMQSMVRQQEGVREVVDCNAIIKSVVTLADADARARGIVINIDLTKQLPSVNVDTVQIQQVILNLLRNGMDAMQSAVHKSGNTIRIRSRLLENGLIEVSVIDYGTGVSEDVAGKIFNPFSTTKSAGMGLGLSISSAIITSHGGQLNFRNNESSGATFWFTLPKALREFGNAK